jgi:hypothetical protein
VAAEEKRRAEMLEDLNFRLRRPVREGPHRSRQPAGASLPHGQRNPGLCLSRYQQHAAAASRGGAASPAPDRANRAAFWLHIAEYTWGHPQGCRCAAVHFAALVKEATTIGHQK